MTTSGAVASTDDADAELRELREKEGKCASCGATTHKFMYTKGGALGLKKKMRRVPLTLAGQCKDGRCLRCNPLAPPAPPGAEGRKPPKKNEAAVVEVVSTPVVVLDDGQFVFQSGTIADPVEVERIVAEEVERILAETMQDGDGGYGDDISQAIEGLPPEIMITIEAPSGGDDDGDGASAAHKRSESAPAALSDLLRAGLTGGGLERTNKKQQHIRIMSDGDYDALDNGSLDHTCGDTYADFPPALVSVSPAPSASESSEGTPSLPGREVLNEIHGLSNASNYKVAHRNLVKLRMLAIQYQRRIEISKAGGVQVIISSLKRFGTESGSTAKQAFAVLQNLASVDSIARSIAQNGGIWAIVKAMETHYKCPGVQEHGCAALRNLTSSNVANRTQVGKAGGIRTIIGAMRYHAESAKICDKAVAALGNLCLKHPENRREIGKEGGVAAILHAMRKHDGHEGVCEKGMRALWDLAHNMLNVELLRAEEELTDFLLGVGVRFPRRCKEKAIQIYLKL